MATRIVQGAGFSITSEPGKPEKTKFHVTGFAKGVRELWVVIPGVTRFEFITLPEKMSKEDAIKYVAGLAEYDAPHYQAALNLERFLEKPKAAPKVKVVKTPVQKDLVMPTPATVTLPQHEKKAEEVEAAFTTNGEVTTDQATLDAAAQKKADFTKRMNLAKMKKIATQQAAVAPIVDPQETNAPDADASAEARKAAYAAAEEAADGEEALLEGVGEDLGESDVTGDGLDIPDFLKR